MPDDESLDRTPIPPQQGPPRMDQDPALGQVINPIPTPMRWGVAKVGHVDNGEPLLMVKFWLVTGEVTLFMPASAAQRLADQLFSNASGIQVAREMPT